MISCYVPGLITHKYDVIYFISWIACKANSTGTYEVARELKFRWFGASRGIKLPLFGIIYLISSIWLCHYGVLKGEENFLLTTDPCCNSDWGILTLTCLAHLALALLPVTHFDNLIRQTLVTMFQTE